MLVSHTNQANVSHNSESKSRSGAAGIFVLGPGDFYGSDDTNTIKSILGCIETNSTIILTVCSVAPLWNLNMQH